MTHVAFGGQTGNLKAKLLKRTEFVGCCSKNFLKFFAVVKGENPQIRPTAGSSGRSMDLFQSGVLAQRFFLYSALKEELQFVQARISGSATVATNGNGATSQVLLTNPRYPASPLASHR